MHTAICTFEDKSEAEQAVNQLLQAGFDRHAVHLEHRHPDGSPMEDDQPHRDRDVVGKFSFFERLFGAGKHAPLADSYTSAVERGLYVVIVEGHDEAEAARAQDVLHGMEAGELNLFHRAGERPLRDVVAEHRSPDILGSFGGAREDMAPSHNREVREGDLFPPEREPDAASQKERAIASQGWGEQRKLEVVDEDKPIASPDIDTGEDRDKPR